MSIDTQVDFKPQYLFTTKPFEGLSSSGQGRRYDRPPWHTHEKSWNHRILSINTEVIHGVIVLCQVTAQVRSFNILGQSLQSKRVHLKVTEVAKPSSYTETGSLINVVQNNIRVIKSFTSWKKKENCLKKKKERKK